MPNEKPIPQQIPIGKIHDLPGVVPADLPDKAYGSMVSSILVSGVKEPLILRQREDGEYELVDGGRRRKASELAKLKEVPALVYDMTEKEAKDYRLRIKLDPKAPIPGKLVEAKAEPPKEDKTAEKAAAPAAGKQEQVPAKKAAEQPAAPVEAKAEPPKTDKAAEKAAAPAADKQEPAPAKKSAEQPAAPGKAKAPKKTTVKEEKPTGTAAVGPTGTTITKILGSLLDPPTAKDKKALPVPGEGEAFSAILHPAYLKKAEINTFSVDREADDFKELRKSIQRFGVKDPVLARFGKDGELEIISGQRRHLIASELNYPVPAIIQQLDDDDAKILVADGNLHREHISTYDLSRAMRMKADSMRRKAGRKSRSFSGPKLESDEALALEMGMSVSKLNRLMKLSEATQGVCDLVDENKLPLSVAYNIAFLKPQFQDTVVDLIGINVKVNNDNTQLLKKVADREPLTDEKIRGVLEGTYPPKVVVKPAPVPQEPATPSMAPTHIPASPDVQPPEAQAGGSKDNIVPFTPSAEPQATAPAVSAPQTPPQAAEAKEPGDRENSYETKVVLRGDRLRKYFPDVSMTPREIEDSVYDALEERRQRQERAKSKADIFRGSKPPVK